MHNDPQTDVIEGRQDNDSRETGGSQEERGEGSLCVSEKTKALFWSKVDARGPNECWLWTAYRDKAGYGHFLIGGKSVRTHRVAWMLHHERILPRGTGHHGICVLHRCDNPQCVNPSHLFLGTQGENNADCMAKGRHKSSPGESHGGAKLTNETVLEIRERHLKGEKQRDIARDYNVHFTVINGIVKRRTWRHI